MTSWLSEYWYVVWGFTGAAIVLGLNLYARRHPETVFASHWDRLKYAAYACAPIGGILILVAAALLVFAPSLSYFDALFSPYYAIGLYAFCWLIAPSLKRIIPLERRPR
jgi:hypothetical protein